jgi:hypothetical protein
MPKNPDRNSPDKYEANQGPVAQQYVGDQRKTVEEHSLGELGEQRGSEMTFEDQKKIENVNGNGHEAQLPTYKEVMKA